MRIGRRGFILGLFAAPLARFTTVGDGVALRSIAHPVNSEFTTDDLLVRARERFELGFFDPRAAYGTRSATRPYLPELGSVLWPFDARVRGYDMVTFRGPCHVYGSIIGPMNARFRRPKERTPDSESGNPGSSPGGTTI